MTREARSRTSRAGTSIGGKEQTYQLAFIPTSRFDKSKASAEIRDPKKHPTQQDKLAYDDNLAKCLFQIHPTWRVESSWFRASHNSPFSPTTSKISPAT